MRVSSFKPVAVGIALTATALLSACSSQNSGAQVSTVTASPENQAQQMHAAGKDTKDAKDTDDAGDVNCSTNGGKVGPEGGKQVDLIAVASKAGTVGCTEAFNVITEYYRDAPTKSEGTARALTVRGWDCMADTGAQGTGIIGCSKDGLSLHTA
jgi:hypothetical protein